jgi:hypothetical protein
MVTFAELGHRLPTFVYTQARDRCWWFWKDALTWSNIIPLLGLFILLFLYAFYMACRDYKPEAAVPGEKVQPVRNAMAPWQVTLIDGEGTHDELRKAHKLLKQNTAMRQEITELHAERSDEELKSTPVLEATLDAAPYGVSRVGNWEFTREPLPYADTPPHPRVGGKRALEPPLIVFFNPEDGENDCMENLEEDNQFLLSTIDRLRNKQGPSKRRKTSKS